MPFVLNAIYLALLVLVSPWLLYRASRTGRYRSGWSEKFLGDAPARLGDRPCVWFHAVSVGEVLLLKPLVGELARRRPGWEVVISTTTHTGLAVARRSFPEHLTFYAPLDFSWSARRALARVRPTVLALVELELWPNLVWAAKRAGAGVAIVNGRLSLRSHRGYRRLRRLDAVAAQTEEYAERFIDLGIPRQRVRVTGSVKYDGLESDRTNPKTLALRRGLGLSASEIVFVAGSTMEGEEAAALEAYRAARADHPSAAPSAQHPVHALVRTDARVSDPLVEAYAADHASDRRKASREDAPAHRLAGDEGPPQRPAPSQGPLLLPRRGEGHRHRHQSRPSPRPVLVPERPSRPGCTSER